MSKSTRKRHSDKPSKPYPDFPLFPHATKRWAKKIKGHMVYFGPWSDPDGALNKYLEQKDDLHAGRKPHQEKDGFTLADLCNKFLNHKRHLVDTRELAHRTWEDYKAACDCVIEAFGKTRLVEDLRPDDFESLRDKLARKWGPVTLGNAIQRIRVLFKFAFDNEFLDRPVRYGQGFKRPSRKTLRLDKAKKGPKLFSKDEIHKLLKAAGAQVKAMILLGINAGFGNADCGTLPMAALDLDQGIVDYPRPKTGIPRQAALWPETVHAIKEALAERVEPKQQEHVGLLFITKYGQPWAKLTTDNTLAKEIGKLLRELKITGRRGLGFYTLRHTFRTVADETKDQAAVDFVMGHESQHMSSQYRETISAERLRAVSDYVHGWLFRSEADQGNVLKFQARAN
jgi:integrase